MQISLQFGYVMLIIQVFSHLFCIQLEGEVNLVLFGLCSESHIEEDCIPDAALKLDKLLKSEHPEISQSITDAAKKLKRLKWRPFDNKVSPLMYSQVTREQAFADFEANGIETGWLKIAPQNEKSPRWVFISFLWMVCILHHLQFGCSMS